MIMVWFSCRIWCTEENTHFWHLLHENWNLWLKATATTTATTTTTTLKNNGKLSKALIKNYSKVSSGPERRTTQFALILTPGWDSPHIHQPNCKLHCFIFILPLNPSLHYIYNRIPISLFFPFYPFSPSPWRQHPSTIYPSIFLSSVCLSVGNGPVMPD